MVAILATVNEADNMNLVRAEGGVLPVFPMPITAAGVVSVGATLPITSTGGPAPVIGINAATDATAGSMSAADKTKLDGIAPGATVASLTGQNGIVITGSAGVPNVEWVGGISVANGAALTALSTTAFVTGAIAYVQTFGALWSYQPASVLTPDGSTVLAAAGGGNWLRGPSAITQKAQVQTTWFVNIAAGNDEADGLTLGTALKHKAEIIRRWGTNAPSISGITVTNTYVSADTDNTDPGVFEPLLSNGGILLHTAALPAAAFTGTLLAVTAKNRGANQELRATFTVTTGAIAANMLLVNVTRGNSRAMVGRNTAGVTWQISQPLAPYVAGTFPTPTEIDTWANGDTIQGFVPLSVDLVRIGGKAIEFNAAFAPQHVVQQITLPSLVNGGATHIDPASYIAFSDCVFARTVDCFGGNNDAVIGQFLGCVFANGLYITSNGVNAVQVVGGIVQFGGNVRGTLSFDVIVANSLPIQDMSLGTSGGSVFLDTGTVLICTGRCSFAGTVTFYGAGIVNAQGAVNFTPTAVACFTVSGGLQLNGVATGYSNLTTAGLTAVHQLALTAANLDAAAGAAGFGGYAYGGGGTFTRAGVQP